MSVKLEIEYLAPTDLKPNPWNTNHVSPENEEKLENSITRFGFTKPIVVRTLENGQKEILGGEHRWGVAKKLGYETIPVIDLGMISDQKAKEIGLVDNGRYGEDDVLALSELLKEIGGVEDLTSFLPYSGDEIENIFSSQNIPFEDLDIPDDDGSTPELPSMKATQTHQIMRFKVPVEDAEFIQELIESTMKRQAFTQDDSMTNAGNALVHLFNQLR